MAASLVDSNTQVLQTAVDKTEAAAAEVQSASLHAQVINTVLTEELPDEVRVADVAQAIEQTDELKEKLAETAQALAEVSASLEEEIEKRRAVAGALAASEALVDKLAAEAAAAAGKA